MANIVVPPFQNFVPGKGHKLLPSAHDLRVAAEKGLPEPQPVVSTDTYTRAFAPVRKNGYENFIPGPGHKLMPTWAQIHEAELAAAQLEPEPEPEQGAASPHEGTKCDKTFDTFAQLNGHKSAHRGK